MPSQNVIELEKHIQAVLVGDTFSDAFSPLTRDGPELLLPLVNSVVMNYTLEWLQRNGIHEVIVYCRHPHFELIKEHCSRWESCHRSRDPMRVTVASSESAASLGDALRDLYSKRMLKEDFVLLDGNIIANVDIKTIIEKFQEIHAKDKSMIMTSLYCRTPGGTVSNGSNGMGGRHYVSVVSSGISGKVLQFRRTKKQMKVTLPADLLIRFPRLNVHPKLMDPKIAICSEAVAAMFSDNYDYNTMDGLMMGIIEQEDLLGYSVKAHILEVGYTRALSCLADYQTLSEAVIGRSIYPYVPERSLTSGRIKYNYNSFSNNYWEHSAKFDKKSIGQHLVIDSGTEIHPSSFIHKSVVGSFCNIKENVQILNSFIMNNVIIHPNCQLSQCFLSSSVVLLPAVTLSEGCVLGEGVVVGPGVTLPPNTRLMAHKPLDEFTDEELEMEPDKSIAGMESNAYVYEGEQGEGKWGEDEEEEEEEEEGDEEEESENDFVEEMYSDEDEERENGFRQEINESLLNALRENTAGENLVLEMNASRHAYNIPMEQVIIHVIKGIIYVSNHESNKCLSQAEFWSGCKKSLHRFADIIRFYTKKSSTQITILNTILEISLEDNQVASLLSQLLYELNQELDILDEAVVTHWYNTAQTLKANDKIYTSISKFVQWLQDAENEDSE